MCGRFALLADPKAVAELFGLDGIEPFPERYNIAPTQPVLVVRMRQVPVERANTPDREAVLARWGLLPGWLKDPKGFPTLINARSETAAEKPAFRAAMRHRRVLFPASGFYEWKRDAKGKPLQAYWVTPKAGRLCAFAGLMETWLGPDGSEIDTACILTTEARGAIAAVHDRMPVAVPEEGFSRWLNCRDNEPREVADLLSVMGDDFWHPVAVSAAVNKVANSGPDLIVPVSESDEAQAAPPARSPASPKPEPAEGPAQPRQMKLL